MPINFLQIPPLLVMCIMLVVYGLIQPYKSQTANVMEMVVQTNFIFLLALESTSFLKDTFDVLPSLQMQADISLNGTAVAQCSDKLTGISHLSTILLPFYYFPVFLFIVTAVAKFIQYIR